MSGNPQGRRNWTLSMTVALIVATAAAVIGFMAGETSVATDRYYLESTAGNVLFDHGRHSSEADSCAACHHDLYGGSQAVSCEECHDSADPDEFEHAELKEFHSRDCATCHEQDSDDDQAASCRSCHPGFQDSEERSVSCTDCHDDDYDPEMLGHDEYLEIEDHSCLGCHAPGSVSEVYHISCTSCHLEVATDRFANDDETVMCSGCHLR